MFNILEEDKKIKRKRKRIGYKNGRERERNSSIFLTGDKEKLESEGSYEVNQNWREPN